MQIAVMNNTALLVIDPLNDFLADDGKLWPYARDVAERLGTRDNLETLMAAAREAGLPLFFAPHRKFDGADYASMKFLNPTHAAGLRVQPFLRGSYGAQFHPRFQPMPGEVIVYEHWMHSAFMNTDLDYQLRMRGIDRLFIGGMRGNACVEGTGRHAVELGYHVTLVKDATATFRWEEWVATMEVNAPSFAHAVLPAAEVMAALRDAELAIP